MSVNDDVVSSDSRDMASSADIEELDEADIYDPLESTSLNGNFVFGRFGTVALTIDDASSEEKSPASWAAAIVEQLRGDSRVTSVTPRSEDMPSSASYFRFFPPYVHAEHDVLATGEDARRAISFDPPLVIGLSVPIKNQPVPPIVEGIPIPTDKYSLVWDGVTAIVTWEQDDPEASIAAGHVVEPILRTAAKAIGCEILVQSCNEDCESTFVHSLLRVVDSEHADYEPIVRVGPSEFSVAVYSIDDAADAAVWLSFRFLMAAENFARMKNVGARLIIVEDAAREELNSATTSHYTVNRPRPTNAVNRLKSIPRNRRARRVIRQCTANTGHFIAVLELLRRQWNDSRRDFESDDAEVLEVFATDFRKDREKIDSLDLERLENITSHISDSLSNWSMAKVTLWGALSGGFAGGILGAVATLLAGG